MSVTLSFKDERDYLTPGALAWLKECERLVNEELSKEQATLLAFGSVTQS